MNFFVGFGLVIDLLSHGWPVGQIGLAISKLGDGLKSNPLQWIE